MNQGRETPVFSPDQTALQSQLYQSLASKLANPNINLDPLKAAAYGGVNRNYAGLEQRLNSQFASRGFGRGGNLANNQTQLELGRQGDLGDIESRFAGFNLDQQNRNMDLATRFGFLDPGRNATGPKNNPLSGFLSGALRSLGGMAGAQQGQQPGPQQRPFDPSSLYGQLGGYGGQQPSMPGDAPNVSSTFGMPDYSNDPTGSTFDANNANLGAVQPPSGDQGGYDPYSGGN